jgi:exosortase/archaeosortase family protein
MMTALAKALLSPLPPGAPLLATTGTELLQFGLLIAAGSWLASKSGKDAGRFVLRAFLFVTFFYLLWPQDSGPQREADRVVMHGMACLVSGIMNLGGMETAVEGISVLTPVRYTMARSCMGLSYVAMAVLCVLAYPMAWRRRALGALGLAAGMIWLNALRIVLLYQLWWLDQMQIHHLVHRVGGVFFAFFALVLFVGVVRGRRREESAPVAAPAMAGARAD